MRAVRIDVSCFQLLALVDLESRLEKNNHGYVKISGYISSEERSRMIDLLAEETWADIQFYDEDGEKNILFCGYLEDVKIQAQAETFLLSATVSTGSKKMDMCEHIRVFQEAGTSSEAIQEYILRNYFQGKFLIGDGSKAIGEMLVQYKETDWEFIKRMAAKENTVLFVNDKSPGVKYTFGVTTEGGEEITSYESYSILNRIGEYEVKKAYGMGEEDAIAYRVKTREIHYLGDTVSFMGKGFVVGEIVRRWEGNELYNYYLLETTGSLLQIPYGNKKIIGASLKGNITDVKKDTVKISVTEDESGGWAGSKWFPYSTVYSSPDGTGWYCMPEKGDSVRLYFPNDREDEAYVNSSVNEKPSDSSARSNPDEKSMKNKQGKEVQFKPDRLVFTNNQGMSIAIIDDEGIFIESDKSITIKAKETIGIISDEQGIQMAAPEKIAFQQGQTTLELADDVIVQGGRVNMQ